MTITCHVQKVIPWTVVTPVVYRIMASEYVEEFFATGRLRLSSFAKFAQHSDEERGDPGEGKNVLFGTGKDQTVVAVTGHGFWAYVLCGTSSCTQTMFDAFGSQDAIRIDKTLEFGLAVAEKLPGYRSGLEGACVYSAGPIERSIDGPGLEKFKGQMAEKQIGFDVLAGVVGQIAQTDVYFRKSPSYAHQVEYRWIWNTDCRVVDHIDITVPEARQFCSRATAADASRWSKAADPVQTPGS